MKYIELPYTPKVGDRIYTQLDFNAPTERMFPKLIREANKSAYYDIEGKGEGAPDPNEVPKFAEIEAVWKDVQGLWAKIKVYRLGGFSFEEVLIIVKEASETVQRRKNFFDRLWLKIKSWF